MTKTGALIAVLFCSSAIVAPPALACDDALFEIMNAALPPAPTESFDVEEVQSTDGGAWDVHRGEDGALRHLVRADFGETGRRAVRLDHASPTAYAISSTRYFYSAPYYVGGATTIREEKDIFTFCDGKLMVPEEDFGLDAGYAGKATEALAVFDATEVAGLVATLKR